MYALSRLLPVGRAVNLTIQYDDVMFYVRFYSCPVELENTLIISIRAGEVVDVSSKLHIIN